MKLALILKALELAISLADGARRAQEVYNTLKEQAQRDHELTAEESAQLDEKARAIFASPASQPSGR